MDTHIQTFNYFDIKDMFAPNPVGIGISEGGDIGLFITLAPEVFF